MSTEAQKALEARGYRRGADGAYYHHSLAPVAAQPAFDPTRFFGSFATLPNIATVVPPAPAKDPLLSKIFARCLDVPEIPLPGPTETICFPKKPNLGALMKKRSPMEEKFLALWNRLDAPILVSEHRFHPKRKWRFDFAHIGARIAVELDGGIYSNGRHNRASGFLKDCEKLNAAAAAGWRVFRLATGMITEAAVLPIVSAIRQNLPTEP